MKSLIAGTTVALGMLFIAPSAYALPKAVCEIRAAMVGAAAGERDKGTSKKKVMAITLKKLGPGAKGFAGYVDLVYENPRISPDDFYKLTYVSCMNE